MSVLRGGGGEVMNGSMFGGIGGGGDERVTGWGRGGDEWANVWGTRRGR